jgi:hypothetical protein
VRRLRIYTAPMQLADERAEPDHDEGTWAYLSVAGMHQSDGEALLEGLIEACERRGLSLYRHDATKSLDRQIGAIEESVTVIVEVGDATPQLAAELTAAHRARRPILALRHRDSVPSPLFATMLETTTRIRTVTWNDATDCVSQVESALGDPEWQQLMSAAIAAPGR